MFRQSQEPCPFSPTLCFFSSRALSWLSQLSLFSLHPLIYSCFGPPLAPCYSSYGLRDHSSHRNSPTAHSFLFHSHQLTPKVSYPLTPLCSLDNEVYFLSCLGRIFNKTLGAVAQTSCLWWIFYFSELGKSEEEHWAVERERVWAFSRTFWLKIEPLSFSPFAAFFVARRLPLQLCK